MKLAVITNDELKEEFLSKQIPDYANVCFVKEPQNVPADTYIVFDLLFENTTDRIFLLKEFLPRPVFINAVAETLAEINQPFIRINAWPTFLKRSVIEVVALPEQEQIMKKVFELLGWKFQAVPDLTGMISARMIGMIINEAYFTLDQKVSTKEEIDIAMKLGTNYPYGPFEWCKKIGLKNIYDMLSRLSKKNISYEVSTLLTRETYV
ncbi:MAG: 3-hydroxyacyl-CoA dehydrogenase family protein [Bacteroidota bacterium]